MPSWGLSGDEFQVYPLGRKPWGLHYGGLYFQSTDLERQGGAWGYSWEKKGQNFPTPVSAPTWTRMSQRKQKGIISCFWIASDSDLRNTTDVVTQRFNTEFSHGRWKVQPPVWMVDDGDHPVCQSEEVLDTGSTGRNGQSGLICREERFYTQQGLALLFGSWKIRQAGGSQGEKWTWTLELCLAKKPGGKPKKLWLNGPPPWASRWEGLASVFLRHTAASQFSPETPNTDWTARLVPGNRCDVRKTSNM